jgi:hypothetical protein
MRVTLFGLLLLLTGLTVGAQDSLSFGGIDLPGAEVRASFRQVSPLAQAFTIEEVRRLPATFYDPARLVALLPGTIQTNDQANHLSVRGNTPNANLWRLNGIAIANPNHTSNAGTFYDFPTLAGGGVNALSAQVLDNGAFLAGGLPGRYGYATGGTFDLRLRPGSREGRKYQLQAGFIGFDAAAEGPFGKNKRNSYLINGRYSFTGLLGAMGVDFGGEEIGFSDLNVHLHRQLPRGEISVFGVLGSSSNIFTPDPDEEVSEQKELFDIDYTNDIAIGGLSYRNELGFATLRLGGGYSRTFSQRLQQFAEGGGRLSFANAELQRISGSAELERVLGGGAQVQAGLEILYDDYAQTVNFYDRDMLTSGRTLLPETFSLAPYLSTTLFFGENDLNVALRTVRYHEPSLLTEWTFEPRLRLRRRWNGQRIVAVAERLSAIPYAGFLLGRSTVKDFIPVTNQLSLAYGRRLGSISALVTTYFQYTGTEYAADVDGFLLSANNFLEFDPSFRLTERTATRRYGVELEAAGGQRQTGWYYRGSLSLFRAETEQRNGDWAKDRYSSDYVAKLTLGREWTGQDRKERPRTYGLNLALIAHGGERTGLITPVFAGTVNGFFTAPDYSQGFVNSNGTYFRPDLRLYRTKERSRATTTWALDLQNVAGVSNTAVTYYDRFLNRPNERESLGFIPVLSYRVVWR